MRGCAFGGRVRPESFFLCQLSASYLANVACGSGRRLTVIQKKAWNLYYARSTNRGLRTCPSHRNEQRRPTLMQNRADTPTAFRIVTYIKQWAYHFPKLNEVFGMVSKLKEGQHLGVSFNQTLDIFTKKKFPSM